MNAEPLLVIGQAYAAILGLVIGSFLAVCIVRLPADRSLLTPSACPCCGKRVPWFDNIPVLSWLRLRGRCGSCRAPISPLYPLVEALSGVLGLLIFRSLFRDPGDLDTAHIAAWIVRFGFVSLALVAGAVDVRHRIIPDETSIYAAPFGIIAAASLSWVGFDADVAPFAASWQAAVLGAAAWGGLLALVYGAIRFVFGIEGIGWGDVKLIAMFGAFLGPYPAPFFVLLAASLSGSVVGLLQIGLTGRRTALPLGPHLAAAAIAYTLYGDVLLTVLFPGARW